MNFGFKVIIDNVEVKYFKSISLIKKYLNVASDHIINGRCRGFVVNPYLVTFK